MTVFSKQDFLDQLNQLIPDNSTQRISPLDIRTAFIDLADSVTSFLIGTEINAANISSPDTRTTRVGDFAIGKMDLVNHSSADNTAVGYYALGGNYNGINNTAVGSKALACNLYGTDNIGVGYDAVGHLVTGSGNVGVGNFTLLGNKAGSYNIAIGHGAGYYINPNDSYKFYLGSYGITADDLCTVITSGAAPLLFGDLQNRVLGIGVNALHAYGALQVNGNVTPSGDGLNSVGDPHARWNQIYASSGIGFLGQDFNFALLTPFGGGYTQTIPFALGSNGKMYASGDFVPRQDGVQKLGDPTHRWDGYFNDIVISGHATIANLSYTTINECLYDCKTLHLATSGECSQGLVDSTVCGFMTDEGIDGGGLEIHSSGVGYRRDYRWIYKFPDQTLTHLEQDSSYSRSRWLSNISIAITGGSHLQTDRVLGTERLSLVTTSGGYGAFIRSNQYTPYSSKFFVGSEDHLKSNYALLNETTNNTDPDVVFMAPSGNTKDFMFTVATPNSGLDVGYRLLSRASGNWVGFGTEYHDDRSLTQDRLSAHVYNGQGGILEAWTVLRNVHPSSGLFGITNIQHQAAAAPILPATIFNVQALTKSEARFSTQSTTEKTRLTLLGNGNVRSSGLQLWYDVSQDTLQGQGGSNNIVIGLDLIRTSGTNGIESGVLGITEKGFFSIGRGVASVDPLTIYHKAPNSGTLALKSQSVAPNATAGLGKVYVKPFTGNGQTMGVYFLDDAGNESQLLRSKYNSTDGLIYGDLNGNTYGGWYCPQGRASQYNTAPECTNNTAYGFSAMSGVQIGYSNVAIGAYALQNLRFGVDNVVIGFNSMTRAGNCSGNVILGNRIGQNSTSNPANCILVGTGLIPTGTLLSSNTLAIGFGSTPLLLGSFDSANRNFGVKDGKFYVDAGISGYQVFSVKSVLNTSGNYVTFMDVQDTMHTGSMSGTMSLRFMDAAGTARNLMHFDHKGSGMTNTPTWSSAARPFVGVSGDVRVLGAIRFADGTYAESASALVYIGGTGIQVSGNHLDLNYNNLADNSTTVGSVQAIESFVAISVNGAVGKMSLANFASYLGSGYATVTDNCNAIFTDSVTNFNIDRSKNASDVFIGCSAGYAATGWKNSIMIGTEAGYNSQTPNVGLATDTASTFIGLRAGRQANNIQNSIFLGTQAGYLADTASVSVFIGANAGQDSQFSNSVGIGQHALRGTTANQPGTGNIEIVAGLLDNQRLLYNQQVNNKLNINNTIAGDTAARTASVGDARLSPDQVFTVYKNTAIAGHSTSGIQSWMKDNTRVAAVDNNGDFTEGNFIPIMIEGYMQTAVGKPTLATSPTSGVLIRRDANWNTLPGVYIINRDVTLSIPAGAYTMAMRINGTYRPVGPACSGT